MANLCKCKGAGIGGWMCEQLLAPDPSPKNYPAHVCCGREGHLEQQHPWVANFQAHMGAMD